MPVKYTLYESKASDWTLLGSRTVRECASSIEVLGCALMMREVCVINYELRAFNVTTPWHTFKCYFRELVWNQKGNIYLYATHEINLAAENETKNVLKYSWFLLFINIAWPRKDPCSWFETLLPLYWQLDLCHKIKVR